MVKQAIESFKEDFVYESDSDKKKEADEKQRNF